MKDKDLKKKNPEGYKQLKALEKFAEGIQKYHESTEYKIELERQYIAEHEENIRSLKRQLSPSHDEVWNRKLLSKLFNDCNSIQLRVCGKRGMCLFLS